MSSHEKSLQWRARSWHFWQPLQVCERKGTGRARVSFHLQWPRNTRMSLPCPVYCQVFCSLRMTKCCLSYLPTKFLGKTSAVQEWPSENKQESCRVEAENLMLSIELRERMPIHHQVTQVKLYKRKKGYNLSSPQAFSDWISGLMEGIGSPFAQVLWLAQQHYTDSSLCDGMQLLWVRVGVIGWI